MVNLPCPIGGIGDRIVGQFDCPALADVQITTMSGDVVHAHRIVLGLGSDYFSTMFSPTFVTAAGGPGAMLHVEAPEWAPYGSVLRAVRYLYTGRLYHVDDSLLKHDPTDEAIAVACGLLRLSDMWLLPHLKQFVEVWLASPNIVTACNVCKLALLAETCSARQLMLLCRHVVQTMWAVVRELPEWAELPEITRDDLTKKSKK